MDGFLGLSLSSCPTGWSELSAAEGRTLLLVNNSYQAGATIGFPLTDGQDPTHSHVIDGAFDLGSKEVSALGGSNTDGAHSGKQPLLGFLNTTSASSSGLPFIQLMVCRFNALSLQPPPSLPIGGVSLWDTAVSGCPAGSSPLQPTYGRILTLGGNASGSPSINPGSPSLEPGKDVPHSHAYSVGVDLSSVNYEGIHGCCDNDPTHSGQSTATGASSESSLNIPYLSVLACNVTSSSSPTIALPTGMVFVTMDPSGCPNGWLPYSPGGSRVVVGTPAYGVPGKTFGGPLLTTSAAGVLNYPPHTPHSFNLELSMYPVGVELATQGGGDYGRAGTYYSVGSTVAGVETPNEQLPLTSLFACIQQ